LILNTFFQKARKSASVENVVKEEKQEQQVQLALQAHKEFKGLLDLKESQELMASMTLRTQTRQELLLS
jgi:hypothetical protein